MIAVSLLLGSEKIPTIFYTLEIEFLDETVKRILYSFKFTIFHTTINTINNSPDRSMTLLREYSKTNEPKQKTKLQMTKILFTMRKQEKILLSILFPLLVIGCAKKMEGAGSASVISPSSEITQLTTIEISDIPEESESKNEFKFGIGASNLRPYLIAGLRGEDYVVGIGLGGIIFSGLEKEYNVITSDLSFSIKRIKGKKAFLGVGGGLGGALASDFNWARENKRTNLTEGHVYSQMNVATAPSGSSVSFSINLRIGAFFIKTPVFVDISNELEQQGKSVRRKKDNISGLAFIPSVGFNIPMVENKVFLYLGLTLPLTTFLIFEPDYHPYVPSFNFAFTF